MTTPSTDNGQENTTEATLFVAFELSEKNWKLGFTTGAGQKPRERGMTARHQERMLDEIAQAKRRFGLPETTPVVSCYEAGREGFWLHRFLLAHGITNHVVDSSANELPRSKLRGIKPPLARSYGPPVWRGNTGSCVHSLEQPQLDVLAIQLRRGFFTALLPDICAHDFFMPMTTYGTNEIPLGPKFATP